MDPKPTKSIVRGRVKWRVRLGAHLTGAEAQQRYFEQRAQATDYIQRTLSARDRLGELADVMSPAQLAEAVHATQRLRSLGATLTEAADFYVRAHPGGSKSPTLEVFTRRFLAARKLSCKSHTLATYNSELKHVLAEFGGTALNAIRQADIEEWAADLDLAPRSVSNVLNTFTTVLNDAVRKELLTRNAAEFVPRPPEIPAPPGILTPNQAGLLLTVAQTHRPALVPAIAIGLFAGLRRSELCALRGRHLILEENLIEVPADIAKTRQRRLVDIRPNLRPWLTSARPGEVLLAGTANADVFGGWLHELAVTAGIVPWPHNALRHSFASYLMAATQNETHVASQMGNSPAVIFKHYRAVVRPATAAAFFHLLPNINPPHPASL